MLQDEITHWYKYLLVNVRNISHKFHESKSIIFLQELKNMGNVSWVEERTMLNRLKNLDST